MLEIYVRFRIIGRYHGSILQRKHKLILFEVGSLVFFSSPPLCSNQLLCLHNLLLMVAFSVRIRRLELEANHLPLYSAELEICMAVMFTHPAHLKSRIVSHLAFRISSVPLLLKLLLFAQFLYPYLLRCISVNTCSVQIVLL
jgi:hypothetical protein